MDKSFRGLHLDWQIITSSIDCFVFYKEALIQSIICETITMITSDKPSFIGELQMRIELVLIAEFLAFDVVALRKYTSVKLSTSFVREKKNWR